MNQKDEQAALWNGAAGRAWVESQALMDDVLRPFEVALVELVPPSTKRVLDVGCGTGVTTFAIAKRLGAEAEAVGADISEPMIEAAKKRQPKAAATNVSFVVANAESHRFEPTFDAVVSRFGVMFFDDSVRAFENLRAATKPDASLECIVWRGPEENPFMTLAERTVASLLPNLPPRVPNAPGQFGFADRDRVNKFLTEAGWKSVAIEKLDRECAFPASALMPYLTKMGPVGRVLQEVKDDQLKSRVVTALEAAFTPLIKNERVPFNAACWRVSAKS